MGNAANGAATMGTMKENTKVRNKEEGNLNSDLIVNKNQRTVDHMFKCKPQKYKTSIEEDRI